MEIQSTRHQRLTVEPDGEASGAEVGMQVSNEILVITSGVGEEDADCSFLDYCFRGTDVVYFVASGVSDLEFVISCFSPG
jgi:hypothetical protein